MTHTLTIGELAKASEVPAKTIRFYEEIGLISPPKRRENGYRIYAPTAVGELSLIRYARDLGIPIPQIKRLMQGCEHHECAHSKEYLVKEIDQYITLLDEKMKELTKLRSKLQMVSKHIPDLKMKSTDAYCCSILGYLAKVKTVNVRNYRTSKGGEKI